MNRWIALSGIVLLGAVAIVFCEWNKVDVEASPAAMLYLVADTEQELTRMPVRFTRLSDEEEIRIGNELARYYAAGEEGKEDPERVDIQHYVEWVGARVAAKAHRRLPYRFHYLPSGLVNAFALPGGHVFIGRGLLEVMDSEDELASVLGHEVEHIDHYHCAERVQREQALRKIPFGALAALPIAVFEAGYSKDQELEADRDGTRLAVETGYSPNGAIRMFEKFQSLYYEYQARAKTPQEEISRAADAALEGYFRSHPLPAERIAQIQKLIASENWPARSERDLGIAFFFWTANAETALNAHKYEHAEQLALRSLKIKPQQERALDVLARAQFAQAEFAGAADSYRKILDLQPSRVPVANAYLYAYALAAADRQKAAAEFERWLSSVKENKPDALQVPKAGLALLAGDAGPASKAIAHANEHPMEDWSPEWLGNLASWYYLAGDYSTALDLLNKAIQQRPGEARYQTARAWVQLQNRTFADAMQSLNAVYEEGAGGPEKQMALAVTLWLSHQPDAALGHYELVVSNHPEWNNTRWVGALYPPLVQESVQQMWAEQARRDKARMARR